LAARLANVEHEHGVRAPSDLGEHVLCKRLDVGGHSRSDGALAVLGILAAGDDAVADHDQPPFAVDFHCRRHHDLREGIVSGGAQRVAEVIPAHPPADEQLLASRGTDEDLIFIAKNGEDPVRLADRFHAGEDRVMLVQQEFPEVGKIGGTVEVLLRTPGPGRPTVVKLDLPGERERAAADDARAGAEARSCDDGGRTFFQRGVWEEFADHSLPPDFGQKRIDFCPVDACFDEPCWEHHHCPSGQRVDRFVPAPGTPGEG
jgi:hypothetical protein